jgi:hypothetical protein
VIDKPITSCLVDRLVHKKGLLSFDNDIVNIYLWFLENSVEIVFFKNIILFLIKIIFYDFRLF